MAPPPATGRCEIRAPPVSVAQGDSPGLEGPTAPNNSNLSLDAVSHIAWFRESGSYCDRTNTNHSQPTQTSCPSLAETFVVMQMP